MTPELHLRVRAVAENVPVVRHALGAVATTRGADATVRGAIALAVTEAVSNVVLHAYRDVDAGVLEVEADSRDGRLAITVRDGGAGITPGAPSPGIGAGLPLISAVADEVALRSCDPGTELRMSFRLAA